MVAVWQGAVSVYRVSRVQDARVLDEPCVRPEGFDLAEFWRQSAAEYLANRPRYEATVRITSAIRDQVSGMGRCLRVELFEPPDEQGWTQVNLEFETEEETARYVFGYGGQMEVLEPQALRERVIDLAEGAATLYARQEMRTRAQ